MPNSYFQFKQFTVHQDKSAMKVCTDSCLFGAWVNKLIGQNKCSTALDIGTGTGLLSLMASQENDLLIDAVEIEENAAIQAKENVSASKWKETISVHHQSLQTFTAPNKYDVIFSNPPFYENDLMSNENEKNAAKHNTTLTLGEIVSFVSNNLSEEGLAMILIPFHRLDFFEQILSKEKLYVKEKVLVRQTPNHTYFRAMVCFTKIKPDQSVTDEIIIRDRENQYSEEFRGLLEGYYLG